MKRLGATVPALPSLGGFSIDLAQMVSRTSWLPNPKAVACFPSAVFPTMRKPASRITAIEREGRTVGMFDDNTTPRWALLWAHGIPGVSKKPSAGWTFAHVWPSSGDIDSYTHLANLAMVPECFASLTDKSGPLTTYLRWHAWAVYRWKPANAVVPPKPDGYDELRWNYFNAIDDPRGFVRDRLVVANCERSKILRPLMGIAAK